MQHISAKACVDLWCAVIAAHIKAARRGDEAAKIWLSHPEGGIAVAALIGADPDLYWRCVRELALS